MSESNPLPLGAADLSSMRDADPNDPHNVCIQAKADKEEAKADEAAAKAAGPSRENSVARREARERRMAATRREISATREIRRSSERRSAERARVRDWNRGPLIDLDD